MADGGSTEEGVDLFEDYENIPSNVQEILDKYADQFENGNYKLLEKVQKEIEKEGYTFDYGLDASAYNLRKIGQKGKYDDDYANGGELAKQKAESDRGILRSIGQDYMQRLTAYRNLFVVNSETYKLINDRIYDLNSIEIDLLTHADKDLRTDLANIGTMADGGYNDPILIAMRANQGKAKLQSVKGNQNQGKISMLLKERARIEREMEQEAELEGGPKADKYATMLIKIDQDIKKLKNKMAMGGTTKFADKVKSIQASLLKRKKVAPSVQKDYGKTYNKTEAKEAATRITGAITAKERLMAKKKK
jgi:hypothetical protein